MHPYLMMLDAATTLAATVVKATRVDEAKGEFAKTLAKVDDGKGKMVDKTGKLEGESVTIYDRGKGKKIQPLAKVEPKAEVVAALEQAGKLVEPGTTMETLVRNANTQTMLEPTQKASLADVNKALQAGGERLKQAARLGANIHIQS